MNKGMLYAAGAYVLWGLLPIYWKALHAVPALEILAHRMAWSLLVVLLLVAVRGRGHAIGAAVRNWRVLGTFTASAVLLSLNWFVYIWGVNAGFIVETSLGYFINPLVNVVLGMLFLRERLRFWQGVAITIAVSGVVYLTVSYGRLPWIALTLACSFGLYGLLRKTASLPSLEGLTMETLVLFVPALGYLLFLHGNNQGSLGHVGSTETLLLVASGVATATPLLLFAAGARMISLTTLGLLQYIAPTLQLLLGVLVYNEQLSAERLVGFCLIWLALAVYTGESVVHNRGAARLRTATSDA
jgi:chloramphenicol-sensitive protein RarD